jgi:hypothetical protein
MNAQRRFRLAVIGASILHAALLLWVATQPRSLPVSTSRSVQEPLVGVELALLSETGPQSHSDQGLAPEMGRRAPLAAVMAEAPLDRARSNAAVDLPKSDSTFDTPTSMASSDGSEENQSTLGDSSTDPSAGNARRLNRVAPRSSGNGDFALAYALSRQEKAPSATVVAEDRLRQSMQQGHADHDREVGLGVPAPLILALEAAARDVAIPTNSTAIFTANFDGSGHLLGLEFGGSNHASPQWEKLSIRVHQVLQGRKLSIARNTKGVDFKLRLVARSQLPSGADPGLAVDVLGVPVKKGQGKRSSRVTLLDPLPKAVTFEIGDDELNKAKIKIPVPALLFTLLNVAGDPADIGAPARHIIRVEVLDEKIY